MDKRITDLEKALGTPLPSEYKSFIAIHKAKGGLDLVVATNPESWDVQDIFEIGSGPDYLQLDSVYRRVRNAIPPHCLPIARDCAGNFYCLGTAGEHAEQIVFWDHERDVGDFSVEKVAGSFAAFYRSLTKDDI